ncbi:hypothetical protein [Candidatus Nitrotoga sp. M5]|uniref:hypothetical protein n=1 Tax=Candidatus Nitrotoga sp. M5 TaxID=2890409 RepID=UPI001EF49C23|nr:hypothetical protein [Candidatus Nitrotoga sp. M5]CAH1387013.1 conserved hypothetical protein [Candidatus Nitrotoga sp. M5]
MTYTAFDKTLPDATTQNGTQFAQAIRDNQAALRDAIVVGALKGWNFSKSGGTDEQPATILYKNSTQWLKIALTWGTTGGEAGNVTVAVYSYSSNSGVAYDTIGTKTITWDAAGLITATTWS